MKIVAVAPDSFTSYSFSRASHSRFQQYLILAAGMVLWLLAGTAYADHTLDHEVENLKGGLGAIEQRLWDCENGINDCIGSPGPEGPQGPPGPPGPPGTIPVIASCPPGSSIRIVNVDGSVECELDTDTQYSPGFGTNLIGTEFQVDSVEIQRRVYETCPEGTAIRDIYEDGSVFCESAIGETGPQGEDGLACWDLNSDGICTDLEGASGDEDKNNDNLCNAFDCQGLPGPPGEPGSSDALINGMCDLYHRLSFPAPAELITESPEVSCNDGIDNDCDGSVDFPNDSDCYQPEICDDGIDNDVNGLTDCDDDACFTESVCGCAPDAYEPNNTFSGPYDLGTLSDTAGGGGGNQDGLTGSFCIGSGTQYLNYANYITEVPVSQDATNDNQTYYFEVVRDPSYIPTCNSYTVKVSNGPVGFETVITVTGNLAPDSDSDWYKFFAEDVPEGENALDSYRVNIEVISGRPEFRLGHVYRGDFLIPGCLIW